MILTLYTLIIACIGIATVVEKYHGTAFVGENIYGSWWFAALWGVLTVLALAYIVKQQLYKRVAVMLLHLSFVVILAGALTTHLTARSGTVRLRTGTPEMTYTDKDSRVEHLPFTLKLKEFRIVNYPGTDAPLDYQSTISIIPLQASASPLPSGEAEPEGQGGDAEFIVSMNHIGTVDGYRLFQQSYDSDGEGVTLGLSYDPYGIGITYAGYLLLLIGIIATLMSRKTQMRTLYRKAMRPMALLFTIHYTLFTNAAPLPVVPADIAHRMGTIHVLYNNRICPLNTVATDFTMKLTGSASWKGYSADEVFFSWMIYYMPWEKELSPDSPTADGEGSGYTKDQKKAAERRAVVEMFYNGQFTKIFPYKLTPDEAAWYSPGGQVLPREIPVKEQFFIKQSMDFLTEAIVTGQTDRAIEIVAKIKLFQRDMIGDLLPGKAKTNAEIFYNTLRSQKWPVFLALTLSLLLCIAMLFTRKPIFHFSLFTFHFSLFTFHFSLFTYVTLHLALRWWLSGHLPVSNGPETMLFMAWVILLLPIVLGAKAILMRKPIFHSSCVPLVASVSLCSPSALFTLHVSLAFGPLVASFCLLVAMLGGSSAITPLMPVLQSPLLSIHVMTVMCAYAIFALQTLLGIYALLLARRAARSRDSLPAVHYALDRATALSQFMLYPAVFLLTVGIFLGAVWANVSWGNYWSWDPKESWALITLMVYALPLHKASVGIFRKPFAYHLYIVVAFLAVLITYFGVNYLLGGMHSYA